MKHPSVKTAISEDLEYTLSVINHLQSCYEGRYAFFKVLTDLSVPGVDPKELTRSTEILERVGRWFNELLSGIPLFSAAWSAPGTFEAKKALDFLEALKPELRWLSGVAAKALANPDLNTLPLDELRILVACIARMKMSTWGYAKGNVRFGEAHGLTEFTAYYSNIAQLIESDLNAAYLMSQAFAEAETVRGAAFMEGFTAEVQSLSPTALTMIHDINVLTARFKGGLSFLTVEFTGPEGSTWSSAGFSPTDAGCWRAYGLSPHDATAWVKAGVDLPSVMIVWRNLGFTPSDTTSWIQIGFSPQSAAAWRDAGFPPLEARSFSERGITDPKSVPTVGKFRN